MNTNLENQQHTLPEKEQKLQADLRNLQAEWEQMGLRFEVSYDKESQTLYIEQLYYLDEQQKGNLGVTALQNLIQIADEGKYKIELCPTPLNDAMSKEQLAKFYRYFGFKYLDENHIIMRRLPKTR